MTTKKEYDELIQMAETALTEATAEHNRARDVERRALEKLDKAWTDFRATYPVKSANAVNKERLAGQQQKLEAHVASGGDPKGFLGERKPEPASPLDANRIWSKGGSVNNGVGIQRRGGFAIEHRGRTVPSEK